MIANGIIDLHVHTGPDVRVRRHTDLELALLARDAGARAVVIKHHYFPTMGRAFVAQRSVPEVAVYGGIVLNETVGGINPAAVEAALAMGAKIVWMPTLHAANHRARIDGATGGIRVAKSGRARDAIRHVCKLTAAAGAAIATGHLGSDEIFDVAGVAAEAGVRHIVINHPEHRVTGLSIARQEELLRTPGVVFERCYSQPAGDGSYLCNREANRNAIRALGPASTIIASDAGQVENPPWDAVWDDIISGLREDGNTDEAIRIMTRENPERVLNPADERVALP